jgi:hypothetical protein
LESSDILQNAFKEYEKVVFKDYHVELDNGKTIIIRFFPDNFYHLLGIHKLSDLSIKGRQTKTFYNQVKRRRLTIEHLEKSVFYDEIKPRIESFTVLDIINDRKLIEFNKARIHGCSLNAKYIFYSERHTLMLILGVTNDKNTNKAKEIFCPSTFFPRKREKQQDKYIVGQHKINIKEIYVESFKHKKTPE